MKNALKYKCMLKQITEFEKFNVFIIEERDLELTQETFYDEKSFYEYLNESFLESNMINSLLDQVLSKLSEGNVFLVTKHYEKLMEKWLLALTNYLI